jgi:hypothetical protein
VGKDFYFLFFEKMEKMKLQLTNAKMPSACHTGPSKIRKLQLMIFG